jgi:phosphatidylinositol 4-kinase
MLAGAGAEAGEEVEEAAEDAGAEVATGDEVATSTPPKLPTAMAMATKPTVQPMNALRMNVLPIDWRRIAFGETWEDKRARVQAGSPLGGLAGWDLVGLVIKSNDDLRQEVFAMQLIRKCQSIFNACGLCLWLR